MIYATLRYGVYPELRWGYIYHIYGKPHGKNRTKILLHSVYYDYEGIAKIADKHSMINDCGNRILCINFYDAPIDVQIILDKLSEKYQNYE